MNPDNQLKTSLLAFAAILAFLITSCKKNDTSPSTPAVDIHYAISTVSGAYPNQTTYIQGLTDLNISTLDNSKATELASSATMRDYKGSLYMTAFGAPASMVKYTFDASGKAVSQGKLIVPGANTFSSIEFINDTVAYASVGGGLARLVIFNPASFQITGEINLTSIGRSAAKAVFYLGMMARDGKLFMGVHYTNSIGDPLYDSAFVAVIDLSTQKVEKLLSDRRTSTVFTSGSVNGFVQDANGDIYITGLGSTNAPSGILRIKKGETAFDPAYFFDLKAVTGKDCNSLYYFGNGLAFTTRIIDPTDAYEFNGPNFEFYKIDLFNKTSSGKLGSLPVIYGASSSIMKKFNDTEILFVVNNKTENSIYSYKIADGSVTKKISLSAGVCRGFTKVK